MRADEAALRSRTGSVAGTRRFQAPRRHHQPVAVRVRRTFLFGA